MCVYQYVYDGDMCILICVCCGENGSYHLSNVNSSADTAYIDWWLING